MPETKRKVPFVEQMQQTECGLCCVAMILRYYKSYESLSSLRGSMEVGRDGLRLDQINKMLKKKGFDSKAYKTSVAGLLEIKSPCILYWDNSHFVVLEKCNKKHFWIVDPAIGRRKLIYEEMDSYFSGIILLTFPNENFKQNKDKENPFNFLFPIIKKNRTLFTVIFILSLLTYISNLLMPISIQKLTDIVIQENQISLSILFLFCVALILNFFSSYIRGKYLIKVEATLEKDLQSSIFDHLLKLPYKFFELRAKGDIIYRINSLDLIKDLLADKIIRGILDFGALVFIIAYMMYQSSVLALVVIVLFFLYLLISLLFRSYIKELNLYELVERSKMQQIQVETIYSILGIKVSGSEKEVYNKWIEKLKDVINRFKNEGYVNNIYNTFNQITVLVSPIIVLFVSLNLYINNNTTIGEMIAFYALTSMFFGYSSSFFQIWQSFWLASNAIERLKDITDLPKEKMNLEKNKSIITGDIDLENISFSYTSENDEYVLSNISMSIKSGQKVAIVGESGSGKSTLAKLLIGLYEPTQGNIYYDRIPIDSLNKKYLRKQMAIVPQEIQLMNTTIFDNIALGNVDASFEEVKKAADVAQISNTIEAMPMTYSTLVSDMGANLSGGQRQRIALARAIINKHKIVILDEATSSLDSLNEYKISNYLKEIGSTTVVIAHRLSTIKNSDVIFVLESGKIIERGTHEDLIRLKGKYYSLFSTNE